jgi:hypothetical protein
MPSAWSKFAMVHLQTGPYFGDEDADGDGNADRDGNADGGDGNADGGDGNADDGDGNADDDWKKLATATMLSLVTKVVVHKTVVTTKCRAWGFSCS